MNIKATIIQHQQGSEAWLQHRAKSLNASDLAAAMGVSKYMTRAELITRIATGIAPEVDAATQRRFDRGHEVEAAARPLAEEIIGGDLFPVVLAAEVDGLPLSASLDGIDVLDETTWEHKQANDDLIFSMDCGDIPKQYHPQLEQGLMLSGAKRCLFMASNGDRESMRSLWYESRPELRAQIIPTWKQLMADVAAYVPEAKAAPVVAAPVETLPAVSVKVEGELAIVSNLPLFGEALRSFIAKIPEQPSTDQEFADTEAACKALKRAEEALDAAESNALAQLADVDAMRRFVADYKALARVARLRHEKLVAQRKEAIRLEIVQAARDAISQHIRELNASMPADYMPGIPVDFAGCIKGLKSVDSIRNAVDTELARAKIAAGEVATRIHAALKIIAESGLTVHDAAALVLKAPEDLAAVLAQRAAAEKAKEEAQRERIRAEEAARLEREAEAARKAREAAEEMALKREQEEAARLERERAHADQVEAARVAREQQEALHMQRVREEQADIARVAKAVTDHQVKAQRSASEDDGERLTLGQINERLSPVSINVAGLSTLGFEPVAQVKASRLYRECDFLAICRAIADHVLSITEEA